MCKKWYCWRSFLVLCRLLQVRWPSSRGRGCLMRGIGQHTCRWRWLSSDCSGPFLIPSWQAWSIHSWWWFLLFCLSFYVHWIQGIDIFIHYPNSLVLRRNLGLRHLERSNLSTDDCDFVVTFQMLSLNACFDDIFKWLWSWRRKKRSECSELLFSQ